jgi:hypothetical protein
VKGNVIFGAGKDQWAFTLNTFAKLYNKKEQQAQLFKKRMWGNNYYNEE